MLVNGNLTMAKRLWKPVDVKRVFQKVVRNDVFLEEIMLQDARLSDIALELNRKTYVSENRVGVEIDIAVMEGILQYESFEMTDYELHAFTDEINRKREKRKYTQLDRYL
jgi:hypothetical protein